MEQLDPAADETKEWPRRKERELKDMSSTPAATLLPLSVLRDRIQVELPFFFTRVWGGRGGEVVRAVLCCCPLLSQHENVCVCAHPRVSQAALWAIFVGDALSMPVHWYYDTAELKRQFGTITDYQAPNHSHPSR